MSKTNNLTKDDIDDEKERKIYEYAESTGFKETSYLRKNYWQEGKYDKLYWAGLDFESFFPSVAPGDIINNIRSCLKKTNGDQRDDITIIMRSIEKMLHFPIKTTGWSNEDLRAKNYFSLPDPDHFNGLPIGLAVGGFLANIALLNTVLTPD